MFRQFSWKTLADGNANLKEKKYGFLFQLKSKGVLKHCDTYLKKTKSDKP